MLCKLLLLLITLAPIPLSEQDPIKVGYTYIYEGFEVKILKIYPKQDGVVLVDCRVNKVGIATYTWEVTVCDFSVRKEIEQSRKPKR